MLPEIAKARSAYFPVPFPIKNDRGKWREERNRTGDHFITWIYLGVFCQSFLGILKPKSVVMPNSVGGMRCSLYNLLLTVGTPQMALVCPVCRYGRRYAASGSREVLRASSLKAL